MRRQLMYVRRRHIWMDGRRLLPVFSSELKRWPARPALRLRKFVHAYYAPAQGALSYDAV